MFSPFAFAIVLVNIAFATIICMFPLNPSGYIWILPPLRLIDWVCVTYIALCLQGTFLVHMHTRPISAGTDPATLCHGVPCHAKRHFTLREGWLHARCLGPDPSALSREAHPPFGAFLTLQPPNFPAQHKSLRHILPRHAAIREIGDDTYLS